jgi:hypothetical protein
VLVGIDQANSEKRAAQLQIHFVRLTCLHPKNATYVFCVRDFLRHLPVDSCKELAVEHVQSLEKSLSLSYLIVVFYADDDPKSKVLKLESQK